MATDSPGCAGARSSDFEYVESDLPFEQMRARNYRITIDGVMASESACADVDLLVMQWPGKVPPDPDRMMLQSEKLSVYNNSECKCIQFHGG